MLLMAGAWFDPSMAGMAGARFLLVCRCGRCTLYTDPVESVEVNIKD